MLKHRKIKHLTVNALAVFISTFCMAQNPIIRHVFTADPAPIVYRDTVFLFTSHDTASTSATNYKMPDWHVFSSTTNIFHYKTPLYE